MTGCATRSSPTQIPDLIEPIRVDKPKEPPRCSINSELLVEPKELPSRELIGTVPLITRQEFQDKWFDELLSVSAKNRKDHSLLIRQAKKCYMNE